MVHVAGWTGLRAGELAGLQVGDVDLSPSRSGSALHVRRAVVRGGADPYGPLKTAASRRRVPIEDDTADLLREHLAEHPHADDPTAPLFPSFRLRPASGPRSQRRHGQPNGSNWTGRAALKHLAF
jgi:integrase